MENKYNQYKKTDVSTADKGKLIVMLYEGAIKFIDIAVENMDFKTYDVVNNNITKAINIINELQASLDMKAGDIAVKLDSIYTYMTERLNKANLEKSVEMLQEVRGYLEEMLSSWKQVANQKMSPGDTNFLGGLSITG